MSSQQQPGGRRRVHPRLIVACSLALLPLLLFQNCTKFDPSKALQTSLTPSPSPTPSTNPTPTPAPGATPTPTATPEVSRTSARVFISGHSLLWEPVGPNLVAIAASKGGSAKFNQQIMSGSTILQRSRGNSTEGSTQYAGYSTGFNRDWSTGLNIVNELNNPQTLGGDIYDTLILTERHDMLGSLQWQNTVKYLRHYHERMIQGNPQAQTYFYEAWLSHKRTKIPEWITYERQTSLAWNCVAVRINHSLAAEGRSDRIKSLPAGAALAELVHRATTSNVNGITGGTLDETLDRLFTDDVHLTPLAFYYVSLVTYAVVYSQSPIGAAYPNGVTAAQAASLQAIAQDYVSNYRNSFATRTLAQCQASMPDYCSTYWNFDWAYSNNPGQIPSCRAWLMQQDSGNPFYYNATNDASYWLLAPN